MNSQSSDFMLPLGLAWEIAMAMSRDGGWDEKLVRYLCDNITSVRGFLGGTIPPVPLFPTRDISPQIKIRIPEKKNRGYVDVRPATLTAAEVTDLLHHFTGDSRKALCLLFESGNEPFLEKWRNEDPTGPHLLWDNRRDLEEGVKKIEINGKRFRLANYTRHRLFGREFQLWEIKEK